LPIRDSKAQIEYVINQNKNALVELLPYGAVSKNAEGQELAELYDMAQAGARAFFDGKNSIENPNLLMRALDYCRSFEGLVMNFAYNNDISPEGVINEGEASTALGLKGIPELAEEIMLNRDLYLTDYTKGRLHFATISSAAAIQLIAKAKKKGAAVSCDISTAHLLFSDAELQDFDSRLKTLPPFRTKKCIQALVKGIKKGVVDALSSDHWPQDIESKKKEFDHAAFGIINLQTAFATANTALKKDISLEKLIELFTSGPERILNLEKNAIEVGEVANFTLFDPEQDFVFEKKDVLSKSKNSPFFGKKLKGVVYGVVNNNKSYFN
jgi:dihydroorotase